MLLAVRFVLSTVEHFEDEEAEVAQYLRSCG
jgi:hypothetical protein